MGQQYLNLRSDGWLAPLAIIIAGYRCRSGMAAMVRSIHPGGAAVIFATAYVAGMVGSFAALLVAAAFIAGLYLSTRVVTVESSQPAQPESTISAKVQSPSEALLGGLAIQSVTFKKPSAKSADVKALCK